MDSGNFIKYIKDPGQLHQVTYQELNSLIEAYPYCQNLHYLAMMKSHLEQHQDFDKKLSIAATYCPNRQFLFKKIQAPAQPQSTSDSFQTNEESPAGTDIQTTTVPEETVIADHNSGTPPPIDDTPIADLPLSDLNNPATEEMKVIEDESGSQLIFKKADMEDPDDEEKRKVVFIEDLFNEPAEEEVPADDDLEEDVTEEIILEEPDEVVEAEIAPQESNNLSESDAVSDNLEISEINESGTPIENLDLHDLPDIDDEEADRDQDVNEFINVPDHIMDDIPFEITNDPLEVQELDGGEPDEEDENETFEQITESAVVEHNIQMELEEDDDDDELEELEEDAEIAPEEESIETEEDSMEESGFAPLPKSSFKSWPGGYTPVKRTEIVEETNDIEVEDFISIEDDENLSEPESVHHEEEAVTVISEQVEQLPELIESTEKKSKKKKKKKKKKDSKKDPKKKSAKAVLKENLEKRKKDASKKKKKKKKKQKIKKLARKSLALHEDVISETLASLLIEQGNIKKAIKMYKKLSVLAPDKSDFFESQIKKLKNKK